MGKFLFIYFVIFFNLVFSQKISLQGIKHSDTTNTKSIVKYIAKELYGKYKEKNKAIYYDNLFRFSLINEDYDLSLSQIDSVRGHNVKNNPVAAHALGSQFEIYINAIKRTANDKDFDKIYEEEFRKKYSRLPVKSQIILPQYFTYNNIESLNTDVNDIIIKNKEKDSIKIEDAIKLCRKYNYYVVAKKTFKLGLDLIQTLEKETYLIYDSISINTKNKGILTLSVVLSNKNKNPENTILINTIYSDEYNLNHAKEFASNGYAGVILNTRGKYLSTNDIEPFEHEVDDINEAINWIIKQTWSNGKVGMVGGSYSGFSQWAAVKKLHPALKTIIPQASVGIGTMDFPSNNNVFTSYALRWLNYVMNTKMTNYTDFNDVKKWNSIYKKWYESGQAFKNLDSISEKPNPIFQRWLTHSSYDEYWQKMVPYKKEFSKINIPILTITGYYDSDQLGALYYYREHYKYNKNATHYVIIGPYDHSGAQGHVLNEIDGYKIDSVANVNLDKVVIEWFDYILKNKEKPSLLKDNINYQVMGTNLWKSTNSIDQFNEKKLKLYLVNKDFSLSSLKENNKNFSTLKINFLDRSDSDELIDLKNNIVDSIIYSKNNLIFSTETFGTPFEFSGNFSGNFKISTNKKDVDIYVKLYELMPNGKYFLLSTYLGRASYAKNSEKRHLLNPYKKEIIPIYNNEFVSKKIEKGSRLVLIVGINKSPLWQINYGTGKDVSEETIADAKEPLEIKWYNDSYIEIPISKE